MIEINLMPGSGKKSRSTGFKLPSIASQGGSRIKDPFMIAAAVSIVAACGSIGLLHVTQTSRADDLTERERRAVQDSTRYVAVLRERDRALAQRDSVRRQLEIIKTIDSDRFIWPHIMDEVSRAMPPFMWLKNIQQVPSVAVAATPAPAAPNAAPNAAAAPKNASKDDDDDDKDAVKPKKAAPQQPVTPPPMRFQIAGNTVDIQALTRFWKLLESSPFVQNVTLAKSELITVEGKEVTEFLLEAEYQRPDSSVIATVPVTLSQR